MKRVIVLSFLILLSNVAFSASIDCTKAKTKIEKQICESEIVSRLDTIMARVYLYAKDELSESEFNNLKNDQHKWLKKRNKCISKHHKEKCLITEYRNQTDHIRLILKGKHSPQYTDLRCLVGPISQDKNGFSLKRLSQNKCKVVFQVKVGESGGNPIYVAYYDRGSGLKGHKEVHIFETKSGNVIGDSMWSQEVTGFHSIVIKSPIIYQSQQGKSPEPAKGETEKIILHFYIAGSASEPWNVIEKVDGKWKLTKTYTV